MSERPSRQERIETRQANRMDRREAREKDMTLEEFREDRQQLREDFQKGQMDKLASNPFKMKLDANLQMEGLATIKAWDGEFKFLRNMLQAAYEKANDPRASEKARALLNKIQDTLGTDVLKTEGTVLKIAGNQLMMVGALTNKSIPVESAEPTAPRAQEERAVIIDQYGRSRTYGTPAPGADEYRPEDNRGISVTVGANKDVVSQRPDGTWINTPINRDLPEPLEEEVKEIKEEPTRESLRLSTGNWLENPVSFQIDIERETTPEGETHYFVDGLPWGNMTEARFKRLLVFNSRYKEELHLAGVTNPRMLQLDSV